MVKDCFLRGVGGFQSFENSKVKKCIDAIDMFKIYLAYLAFDAVYHYHAMIPRYKFKFK